MQKKKINKVLIAAVALIWGVVVYKLAGKFFTIEEPVITAEVLVKPLQNFLRKKDTFQLKVPDRDPFLGKLTVVRKKKTTKPIVKPSVRRGPVAPIKNWPRIEYLGFVKSAKSSSRLGLLRIDGVLKRVRKGAEVKGVMIKSIEEDKISILFQKEVKDFAKMN